MAGEPETNPEQPVGTDTAEAAPATASGGGIKSWLPLLLTMITMPALAYVTTAFVLAPRMQRAVAAATSAQSTNGEAHVESAKPAAAAAEPKAKKAEKSKEAGPTEATLKERGIKVTSNGKTTVPLSKILVNISGSMGSRYLLTSLTLASDKEGFAELVLNNEAQLVDLASSVLTSKTIADLEKPEARTVIRAELQTVLNNALGSGTVQDIYFTEFAIQ